jgi:hypothetical protein
VAESLVKERTINASRHNHAAKERLGMGDLNMTEIVQGVFSILAGASLYGLTLFLFRDQIKSGR